MNKTYGNVHVLMLPFKEWRRMDRSTNCVRTTDWQFRERENESLLQHFTPKLTSLGPNTRVCASFIEI